MVELPDLRQRGEYDCGLTAVRIALAALRRRLTPEAAAMLATDPIDGTDPRAIETALRALRLRVASGSATWSDLRHYAKNRPVLCLVQHAGVGHWVVVGACNSTRVTYQCPATGPCQAARSSWMPRWRDVDRLGVHYRQWAIAAWR